MIVYFGGSFNPIHTAHLMLAEELYYYYKPKYVLFVPTSQSPLKEESPVSGDHRIAMIKKAIRHDNRFVVTSIEVQQGDKPAYTVDTVQRVIEERDPEVILALGSDELYTFNKWKDHEKLIELCKEVTFIARQGSINPAYIDWDKLNPEYKEFLHSVFKNTKVTKGFTPISLPISSSDIRKRIKEGRPYKSLLHPDVAAYIEKYGLYKGESK